jgi:D-alanyl-D-alanine-carboxypeptidase/D-alanyl-D-alanine-endopeptidase
LKEIEEILKGRVTSGKNIGIVAGVVKGNKTQVFSSGTAAKNSEIQLYGDSIFEIGSVTKVFTATLLANMVNNGLLNLNLECAKHLSFVVHRRW